jgi:hypothetical protein
MPHTVTDQQEYSHVLNEKVSEPQQEKAGHLSINNSLTHLLF